MTVDDVVEESALIDPTHVQNLAESMMGDRGQISPTTLRARFENNKEKKQVVYDVIDGFHRSAAKRYIQERTQKKQDVKAIVLYDCSDEELFDLRVLAASSVKSIKFARMAEWMQKSYESTKWKNARIKKLVADGQMTLAQVFTLAQTDSSGKILQLTTEEVVELKEWAERKASYWGRPLSSLVVDMRTVESADPELVQMVRTGGGGSRGRGVLTRARLDAIVKNLPGQWDYQKIFARIAIEQNILAQDLEFLTWAFSFSLASNDQKTMGRILDDPKGYLDFQEIEGVKQNFIPPLDKTVINEGNQSSQLTPQNALVSKGPARKAVKRGKTPRSKNSVVAGEDLSFIKRRRGKRRAGISDREPALYEHQVPEIMRALSSLILESNEEKLTILSFPNGKDLVLNTKESSLVFGEESVTLSSMEKDFLVILSLLEGMPVSLEIIAAFILGGEAKLHPNVSIKLVADMVQEKLTELSLQAGRELRLHDAGSYSWLSED